jgi:hypothetical protein
MRRLGDGTTRISSRVPDATATRLATYLEAFTNPRVKRPQDDHDAPGAPRVAADLQATAHDPVARLAYPKRMGQALVLLLETVDPTRLPLQGGDATTVVVTIDFDNGVLLCHHHHHRIHDTGYRTDRLPNGDLRFHRRR